MSYHSGVCNFCGTGCGHLLNVENGRAAGVFPSPGHPVSRGRLCVRGWHIHELLRTEERITRPLIRRKGKMVPVSWAQALAAAASGLRRYKGKGETAFWASPRASNEDVFTFVRLARAVCKSPHISLLSDLRHRPTIEVLREGTGRPGASASLTDIRKADFILVVGTDLTRQNPIIASEIHMAARRGADVVVLSSRRTQMARLGRTHLRIAPGAKGPALAALAKGLAGTVPAAAAGAAAFLGALEAAPLEALAARCGLSVEAVRDVARRLKAAPRAVAVFSSGITGPGRDTVALIHNLFLAAGHAGREGCGLIPVTGVSNLAGALDMGAAPDYLPGWRKIPDKRAAAALGRLWGRTIASGPGRAVDELLDDPASALKALVVMDHDEEINLRSERIAGLKFILYIGAYANPFAEAATVVLPSAAYTETDGTYTNTDRRIQLVRRTTEPRFESRPAWRIFADLAARLGNAWTYESASSVFAEIVKAVPLYAGAGHKKLEAAFGGLTWPVGPARGPAREPRFVPLSGSWAAPTPVSDDFPFLLMAGKSYYYWHQNNIMKKTFIPRREYNALLMLYPKGLVEVHPEDAARLGLRDRRPVRVVSARASMEVAARVTTDVPRGAVYAPYFIGPMIPDFLAPQAGLVDRGEDGVIPVRLEKV